MSDFQAADFTLDRRYEFVPAMTGWVTKTGLEKLSSHPDVVRVHLDMEIGGQGRSASDL